MERMDSMEPMELLERYLQAVGRYLPEARRADILAELGGNLREEMEARAEAQGRPLNEDEVAEVLRRYGHPVAVAARYGNASPLIRAEIAPFYWFTLRRVTPFVVAIVVFAQVVVWLAVPSTSHRLLPLVGAVGQSVFSGVFSFWATATLVFAVVDWIRRRSPQAFAQRWDPRKLPKLRTERREGLPAHPVFDLVFNVLFFGWLFLFPHLREGWWDPAWVPRVFGLHPAPVWQTYYWLLVGLASVQILFKGVALGDVSPRFRRGLKAVEGVMTLGVLTFLLRVPVYLVAGGQQPTVGGNRALALWNAGVHQSIAIAAAVVAIKLVWDVTRLVLGRVQGTAVRSAAF